VPASAVEALNLQGASWFGRNEDEYVLVLDTPARLRASGLTWDGSGACRRCWGRAAKRRVTG